jgi:hypothetical protein
VRPAGTSDTGQAVKRLYAVSRALPVAVVVLCPFTALPEVGYASEFATVAEPPVACATISATGDSGSPALISAAR